MMPLKGLLSILLIALFVASPTYAQLDESVSTLSLGSEMGKKNGYLVWDGALEFEHVFESGIGLNWAYRFGKDQFHENRFTGPAGLLLLGACANCGDEESDCDPADPNSSCYDPFYCDPTDITSSCYDPNYLEEDDERSGGAIACLALSLLIPKGFSYHIGLGDFARLSLDMDLIAFDYFPQRVDGDRLSYAPSFGARAFLYGKGALSFSAGFHFRRMKPDWLPTGSVSLGFAF